MQRAGRIITFYSYKGGTGRSMALSNIAWILACAGRRVLVIDWDLEAPGLHRYFRPFLIDEELSSSEGLMDLIDAYANEAIRPREAGEQTDPNWYLQFADISNYIVSINFPQFRSGGKIDLLPAGRQGDHYAIAVSTFNWQNFYDRLGGGGFFEALKQQIRRDYDYVLIDSRTGVSDTAGICSVQMPDTLVVCFTYNNQSIKGAAAVAHSACAMRERMTQEKHALRTARPLESTVIEEPNAPYRVFPIPMRVTQGESDRLAVRQAFARSAFADLLGHMAPTVQNRYWSEVEIPHDVLYSYEEVLAPFKDRHEDPKSILGAFRRITQYLTDHDVNDFSMPLAPEVLQQYVDAFAETPLTAASKKALVESRRETDEETLARNAEEALAKLNDEDRARARRVLLSLVRLEDENSVPAAAALPLREFDEHDSTVIQHLTNHCVLEISRGAGQRSQDKSTVVTLRDPQLLASWPTYANWIDSERAFLVWRQGLRRYMLDWERSGHDRGALLSGRLLNEADLIALRRQGDLSPMERNYIEASRSALAPLKKARIRTVGMAATLLVAASTVFFVARRTHDASPPIAVQPSQNIPTVLVPDLLGVSCAAAQSAAQQIELQAQCSGMGLSGDALANATVIAQQPAAKLQVHPDAVIQLEVAIATTTVPTLVGKSLNDSLKLLSDHGLKIGKTEARWVKDAPAGTVIEQFPAPSAQAGSGADVNLVVARDAQLSDFRIGIYYPTANKQLAQQALRIEKALEHGGTEAHKAPRDETFFVGALKVSRPEIRYDSEPELRGARQLQALLLETEQTEFTLVKVRQTTEGSISVFLADMTASASPELSLKILGRPGEPVQVWSASEDGKGKRSVLYTGTIGTKGMVEVPIPRIQVVVGGSNSSSGRSLDLRGSAERSVTVKLEASDQAPSKY